MKYDGYSDFRAGVRFLESLVSWLRHFDEDDRPAAYEFVKDRLVYISALEMQTGDRNLHTRDCHALSPSRRSHAHSAPSPTRCGRRARAPRLYSDACVGASSLA